MYSHIIIGAGSAGCVLANRLSAEPANRVLLLEAGKKDSSPLIHMPAGVGKLISGEEHNWYYNTAPQEHLDGRRLFWPRGKVLGGSSSINGMIYIRGHASDYDRWRQLGLEGWSYADVLPYFQRAESNENGADDFHGGDGPLSVANPEGTNVLFDAFAAAGQQAGQPFTPDFNGARQEGVGPYQLTIRDGRRCSTATAYLLPALERSNLTVITEAMTTRILFQGNRATGVEYLRGGKLEQAQAETEVLLCGGAVNSPQTLMLSGIGPAAHLQQHGIKVLADLPGVGQNLQDHLDAVVLTRASQPVTLHSQAKPLNALRTGLQYLLARKGLGRSQGLESGAFLKTRPELDAPDIQLHFIAAPLKDHGRAKLGYHGYSVHICQLRPRSTGSISLVSTNPQQHPLIQPNYLADPQDRQVMRDGVRLVREILAQPALAAYRGPEMEPGSNIQSDEDLDAWIRASAETIYHPVGTAKMGVDDMAVVDSRCRVHGIDGLRVVDASVMPTLVGGNTNAPTIMVAEKISDDLLGRAALPAAHLDSAGPGPAQNQASAA